jgi:hypothetical protein
MCWCVSNLESPRDSEAPHSELSLVSEGLGFCLMPVNYYKYNFEQGTETASPVPWVAVNYYRFVPSLGFRNLWSLCRPEGAEHNMHLCRHRHILASAWLEESPCHWIPFKWLSVWQTSTCLHWLLYPLNLHLQFLVLQTSLPSVTEVS